jgi:Protein of unknown function (DUF3386)
MQPTTLRQRLVTTLVSILFFVLSWFFSNLPAIAAPANTAPANTAPASTTAANTVAAQPAIAQPTAKQAPVNQASRQPVQPAAPAANAAEAQFKAAYEKRYAWDKNFPGFTADVAVKYGTDYIQGSITLQSDLGFKTEKILDQQVSNLIASQVQMVAGQFDWQPFEVVHKGNMFKLLSSDQPGIVQIEESNEQVTTLFRLAGDRLFQVNRNIGDTALELKAIDFKKTAQGEIPSHFNITLRDIASGNIVEQDDVRDTYEKIGNYYLLSKREVRTDLENPGKKLLAEYSVTFTNLQLQHQ